MNKLSYLLSFSFLLLSGNPHSFATDDLKTPLLQGNGPTRTTYSALSLGGSIQESDREGGRGAGSAADHLVTDTRRPSSQINPFSLDNPLLSALDVTPAEQGLAHIIHYLYFIKAKKMEEEAKGKSAREIRKAEKAKGGVIEIYRSIYTSDDQLGAYLFAQALAAVQDGSSFTRLSRQSADRITNLQELVRQLIGEVGRLRGANQALGQLTEETERLTEINRELSRQIEETQRSRQESASTAVQISPPMQTTDVPDQQDRIESLVRSNRYKCYAIGGFATALGLSLVYGIWSLVYIFH